MSEISTAYLMYRLNGGPSTGGGFAQKLKDGKLGKAFLHADNENTRILIDTFGGETIQEHADRIEGLAEWRQDAIVRKLRKNS